MEPPPHDQHGLNPIPDPSAPRATEKAITDRTSDTKTNMRTHLMPRIKKKESSAETDTDATRTSNRITKRAAVPTIKSRNIPNQVWETYKPMIHQYYIEEEKTLDEVKRLIHREGMFSPSPKQWKAQLRKWNFRKKMSKEDAAYIAWLYDQADEQGIARVVLFNDVPKTREEIRDYVRKSALFETEQELLENHLDKTRNRLYIHCRDGPLSHVPLFGSTPQSALIPLEGIHVEMVTGLRHFDPIPFEARQPITQLAPNAPFAMVSNSEALSMHGLGPTYFPLPASYAQLPQLMLLGDQTHGVELMSFPSFSGSSQPPFYIGSTMSSLMPSTSQSGYIQEQKAHPGELNDFLSYTPVETDMNESEIAQKLDEMFGMLPNTEGEHGNQLSARDFLRYCCQAGIYRGQKMEPQYESATQLAISVFLTLLRSSLGELMLGLNDTYFLLDLYGQGPVISDLLSRIWSLTINQPRTERWQVLIYTLSFMLAMKGPGEESIYDLNALHHIENLTRELEGSESKAFLVATYNSAWALLEMKRHEDALTRLQTLRLMCENTCGSHELLTITCISTLARAYSMDNQRAMAANTYRDAATKIKQAYSDSHPFFWTGVYRQACYDRRLADAEMDPSRKQAGWKQAEREMKQALVWRANNLGTEHPHTNQTFGAVQKLLRKQESLEEADNLFDWVELVRHGGPWGWS